MGIVCINCGWMTWVRTDPKKNHDGKHGGRVLVPYPKQKCEWCSMNPIRTSRKEKRA